SPGRAPRGRGPATAAVGKGSLRRVQAGPAGRRGFPVNEFSFREDREGAWNPRPSVRCPAVVGVGCVANGQTEAESGPGRLHPALRAGVLPPARSERNVRRTPVV